MSEAGVKGFAPGDGALLWQYDWSGDPIVQPAVSANGDLMISVSALSGLRSLEVAQEGDGAWRLAERWTTSRLKPYYNDFVLHAEHAYGFDGGILACVDLAQAKRQWKGGRYGHGQLVLLEEQELLLVLSEQGEVVLVEARPEAFNELARFQAIESKTWNHPVLAEDILLVRNAEEIAAYRLARLED